jgi:hypothetical protein
MTVVALVVADPRTSDTAVEEHLATLRRTADVRLVDLRRVAPAVADGRPLPVRAVRALTAGWVASRGARAHRALLDAADVVVAGDRFAVPTVWRARRRNRAGALLNGVPAAVRLLSAASEQAAPSERPLDPPRR